MKNLILILSCLFILCNTAISQGDYSIPLLSGDQIACIGGDSSTNLIVLSVVDIGTNGFGTEIQISSSPEIEYWDLNPDLIGINDTLPDGRSTFIGVGIRLTENFNLDTGLIIITLVCADENCMDDPISDTVTIVANNNPSAEIQTSADMFCTEGDTILLVAQDTISISPITSYLWSNGSTGPFLEVDTPGIYWVDITNDCGTTRDSITIHPGGVPVIDFEMSTCNYFSDSLIVTVFASDVSGDSLSFTWTNNARDTLGSGGDFFIESDSFSSTLIVIDTSGDYTNQLFSVSVSNNCGNSVLPFNCSVALPINLVAFEGEWKESNVLLEWSTASERNNDFFTVERSSDGIDFSDIAQIKGAGNSDEILNYSFLDELHYLDQNATTLYYRLKQTDFDGQYAYSDIIVVHLEELVSGLPDIKYAYFEGNRLNLSLVRPFSGELNVELISIDGRQLMDYSSSFTYLKDFQHDVETLVDGIYIAIIRSDQQSKVIKIKK